MKRLRAWVLRLGGLFNKDRRERELAAELESHLQMHAEDNLRRGMTPEEARRQALIKLGGVDQTKEAYRERRGLPMIETLIQDARYAARMLRKNPSFTAVAVLTLALGIGATTAIFTLMDAVMLRSLPVRDPKQLVLLQWTARDVKLPYEGYGGWGGCPDLNETPASGCSFSNPTFEEMARRAEIFSGALAFAGPDRTNASIGGQAEIVFAELVSGSYFSTLGVEPMLGRALAAGDDRRGAPQVAVLSHSYWQRRFGSDPSVIGRAITLNRAAFVVVGVTPPDFIGLQPGWARDLWVPLATEPVLNPRSSGRLTDRRHWWIQIVARLKPGDSREKARAAAELAFRQSVTAGRNPTPKPEELPRLELTQASKGLYMMREMYSKPLEILMAIVSLVLLIACTNVANLLLARATAREREMAVRVAIGAGRGRLVRQLLTESLILTAMGGLCGLLLAYGGATLLVRFISSAWILPLALDTRPDPFVLGFALAVSLITGILFGLAPALTATRLDLTPALKESYFAGRIRRGPRRRVGLASTLVAFQVALSLLLVVSAGLLVRTLVNLEKVNLGFNRRNLLLFGLDPTSGGYKGDEAANLYKELRERIAALPGVVSVGSSTDALISESYERGDMKLGDRSFENVNILGVGPGFFETMGIRVLFGRTFGPQDDANAPLVAIVNEVLARRLFAGQNPLGRHFSWGGEKAKEIEIVGVAANANYDTVREEPPPTIYLPFLQRDIRSMHFEVRTAGDPKGLVPTVRRLVNETAKDLPLFDVRTQSEQIDQTLFLERIFSHLSSFFGLLALVLTSVGLYGTISYAVTRRTSEIGVRMALGAQRFDLLSMVLKEALLLVMIGVAVGLPMAFLTARLISSQLFGVRPSDPLTGATAILLMAAVALCAAYVPARRATRVDPTVALRYE